MTKCTDAPDKKNEFREIYKSKQRTQRTFDKTYRKLKRYCVHQKKIKLESMVNSNGSDLWKEIETIGPPLIKSKVPEEICINNIVSKNTQIVLDTWANKFSNLYKGISDDDPKYDQEFLYTCQNKLLSQAPSTNAHTHYSLNILNEPIAQSEVKNHILVIKSKNGKTISVDGILNEILKMNSQLICLQLYLI